ncbi:hypothetical protein [Clostridium sp. SM-530-WT-3G]|uniref:hypothetical protein n=1 Tax=Clostridium sp. SM-530-WT-3G TaxID=2725303 RepID=UPI00145CC7EC|nr:hypothetical protein [Clostridium sp. SM-530-WT-3G]NME83755.1 hypothetical protein [Clostridium sp. SM-530-WT-3G]
MKMKKLISIGALVLTITTCTSVNAFASTSTSIKHEALQSVIKNGLDGENEFIFNRLNINAHTPIGNYLTDNFISEANEILKDYEVKIESNDNYYKVQKKIALKIRTLNEEQKTKALGEIKTFLNTKLDSFLNLNDSDLKSKVNDYFKASSYGTLTVGRNSNNNRTVTLEDKNGNVLIQVNSSHVYRAKAKLDSVNTYDELKKLILSYYPDAKDYFDKIK